MDVHLALAASCSAVPFPFICSAFWIWCTNLVHFQHLCCIHHVEASAGERMVFSGSQSMASFSVPCCRQRIHHECLARSVHSCGDRCPFCTQDLVPALFEHLHLPINFNAPAPCELCSQFSQCPLTTTATLMKQMKTKCSSVSYTRKNEPNTALLSVQERKGLSRNDLSQNRQKQLQL